MIDPKANDDKKLRQGRELWEGALDHYAESNKERRVAAFFYHNTKGEGQWDRHDREFLEAEGRPVLSFNLCKTKVDAMQGMLEDVRMRPVAKPVGKEDTFLAEIHTALLDRARDMMKAEDLEWRAEEHGLVRGDGVLALDVAPDPRDPVQLQFTAKVVEPHEVMWDTSSSEPDRSDAKWVTWDRWYSLADFKSEYPDHADKAEMYLRGDDYESESAAFDYDDPSESAAHFRSDRDYEDERYQGYYDRRRQQIRVIAIEYTHPIKKVFLTDPVRGISKEIKPELVQVVKRFQESGRMADLELITVWDEQVHWLHFIKDDILFDEPSPQPFSGFSLIPFTCFIDDSDNTTYGTMRNLIDPQREVNKSRSQALEVNISQSKPGYIAEKGAIPNLEEFERQNNQGSAVAIVEDGALTAGRVIERNPARIPEAAVQRGEDAVQMVDRIGGIGTDLENHVGQAEALGTVQLRYRRAQIAMRAIFKHAEQFQVIFASKVLEAIARAFPDFQIERMLGDTSRYLVRDGKVIELVEGPQGPQPGRIANLRDLRTKHFDIDLESTTANNTLRLMELQQLAALAQAAVPVDPAVMVEKAVASRSDRERLLEFIEQQSQAQQRQQAMEAEQLRQQLIAGFQLEERKADEEARHNVAEEALKARGQQFDLVEAFAKILEPQATDELERTLLEDTRARIEAHRYQRSAPNGRTNRGTAAG